jgi:1,4-alpha-glucan branching enzyme
MSVKKNYVKSKNICRVTFTLPESAADQACVVGDFNAWNQDATPMKRGKQGLSVTVDLKPGREYQFRYLLGGDQWMNDDDADKFAPTCYPGTQNCVIVA